VEFVSIILGGGNMNQKSSQQRMIEDIEIGSLFRDLALTLICNYVEPATVNKAG